MALKGRRPNLKDFDAFAKKSAGATELHLITQKELPGLVAGEIFGKASATHLLTVMETFCEKIEQGGQSLCLCCEHEFNSTSAPPRSFMICKPFAANTPVIVTGVCETCEARDDLRDVAVRFVCEIWPGAYGFQ